MKSFWKGFEKRAASDGAVATVAVLKDGKMLWGRRRDTKTWTTPGGHLDPGESPIDGAHREVLEEAGLEIKNLKHIASKPIVTKKGEKLTIHAFTAEVDGDHSTSMKEDPDQEVHRWHWVDISKGLPKEQLENLHSPDNVLLQAMGLQQRQSEKAAGEKVRIMNGDHYQYLLDKKKQEKTARRLPLPSKDDFLDATREGFVQGVSIYADKRAKKKQDNYIHGRPH